MIRQQPHSENQPHPMDRERLSNEIAALAATAGEFLQDFGNDKLHRLGSALDEVQATVRAETAKLRTTAGGHVRSHPWKWMAAAGAAGVLVALLATRR